ncbi:hypothetical protein N9Y60_00550 [Crocinitomicaceae bacterium]|nr:hypothetical protein [Crocinitomicaceae bacterium]MDB3907775.1 hypothetical protein [Crocinitomicaceae bacterium]
MLPRIFTLLTSLFVITASFAQEEYNEENRECIRLRTIGVSSGSVVNYPEAIEYFIKAEAIYPYFGKDNYDRLLACVQNVMAQEEDTSEVYQAYLDTLLMVWEKAEEKGFYDEIDDISRGYHYTLLKNPDYQKADMYMSRGIKTQGIEIADEVYLLLYYYNIYALWYIEQNSDAKNALKQRYINEYLELTKLIKDANFAISTQETLTQYLA